MLCACQSRSGLYISLGFFDDVFVPGTNLPMVSYWDESEGSWVWSYEGEKLPFEKGEDIRVKVVRLEFHAVPGPAQLKEGEQQQQQTQLAPCAQCRSILLMQACST
jgi:DNA-directed RNA polymerase III subunit RPC8